MATKEETYIKSMYVYKITLDKFARQYGGKLHFLNQHTVLWGIQKKDHPVSYHDTGACVGLACEWVKAQLTGDDFLSALATARNDIFAGTFGQETKEFFDDVNYSHGYQFNLAKVFEDVAKQVSVNTTSYPYNKLSENLKSGNFYIVATPFHATAAMPSKKGKVNFYDPNVGCVIGADNKIIADYLAELLKENKDVNLTITKFKPLRTGCFPW